MTEIPAVHRVDDEATLADALAIRRAVFVDEQGVPADLEVDEFDTLDSPAMHFVAYDAEGDPVRAARFRPYEGAVGDEDRAGEGSPDDRRWAKVERVAVRADYRGRGLGAHLMDAVEEEARTQGYDAVVLNAQSAVEEFYRRRGYRTVGDEFEEAGIPHVTMVSEL